MFAKTPGRTKSTYAIVVAVVVILIFSQTTAYFNALNWFGSLIGQPQFANISFLAIAVVLGFIVAAAIRALVNRF